MKRTICIIAMISGLLFANVLLAQDTLSTQKKKNGTSISFGHKGLKIMKDSLSKIKQKNEADSTDNQGEFEEHWVMMGLGFNTIVDNTNYNSTTAKNFLNVPANRQNSSLFALRRSKSINVDIYPFMETYNALKTDGQRINISTGIGLQLYNFSYENPVTYSRNPPSASLDTMSFRKDKLAFDYLTVPLMFTFKTRLYKQEWLVYSVGITEGYNLASWAKQQLAPAGKVKTNLDPDFATFSTCLTAEIGVTDIRLYATYQATNLYSSGLVQHPFSFGFRLFGI